MPKQRSGASMAAPQIKTIRLKGDALSASPGASAFGGGGASGKTRRRPKMRALSLFGPASDATAARRTQRRQGGGGMKRSEMMRKIRHGLLEKRRAHTAAPSTPKSKHHPTTRQGSERKAETRRGRRTEGAVGAFAETPSISAAERAIRYFENKKRERAQLMSPSSSSPANTLGRSMADVDADLADTRSSKLRAGAPKVHVVPEGGGERKEHQIQVELPSTFDEVSATSHASNGPNKRHRHRGTTPPEAEAPGANGANGAMEPEPLETFTLKSYDDDENGGGPGGEGDGGGPGGEGDAPPDADAGLETGSARPKERERSHHKRRRKGRGRFERRKTYRLGKKGGKVSVMIYGQGTRKKLRDDHSAMNEGDISRMRRVLRHRCLLKTGSTAPPNLVREIYRNTKLFGDVVAHCNANEASEYLDLGAPAEPGVPL